MKEKKKNKITEIKDKLLKNIEKDIAFNDKLRKSIKADDKKALAKFNIYTRNTKNLVDILSKLNEIDQEYQDNIVKLVMCDDIPKEYFN